jgi:hypothetical protein
MTKVSWLLNTSARLLRFGYDGLWYHHTQQQSRARSQRINNETEETMTSFFAAFSSEIKRKQANNICTMRMMTRIQTYPVLSYECCGNPCISAEMDDLAERRQAELDFVEAAYAEDEAWCGNRHQGGGGGDSSLVARTVYRRLETDASRSADERV